VSRVLVVTNDFPPRPGGIQTFVYELVRRMPAVEVVVYTSRWRGWKEFDAAQDFEVVREDTQVLLPTPAVRRRAAELLRSRGCDSVLFGAAAPLGLLGPALRAAGAERTVALTHGHEAGWAQLPGARQLLRRIGDGVDVVTYLGEYTRRRIGSALSEAAERRMVRLTPGVDTETFVPDPAGRLMVRERYGLGDRPVVVCVSRLMPRKGQDTLVKALPGIRRRVPGAALLLVGGGPYRGALEKLAAETEVADDVLFTGSVSFDELPAHYAAGDVFAMPCRTRRGGLDVEGLGIVYLEASATGLPVVAGDSGGAPDAVLDGRTGFVVRGGDAAALTAEVTRLLASPEPARTVGGRGRDWVRGEWSWEQQSGRLGGLLDPRETP
jgi:phosphatidylinositol alpha-1,6-mannosyltransferase